MIRSLGTSVIRCACLRLLRSEAPMCHAGRILVCHVNAERPCFPPSRPGQPWSERVDCEPRCHIGGLGCGVASRTVVVMWQTRSRSLEGERGQTTPFV